MLALGLGVGAFGTLIGAGGGFLMMPIFMVIFPDRSADELTAISLAVIAMNALSGTIAYARKGRVDFHSGTMFAAASVPGAILGALTTTTMSREVFDPIFASLLFIVGLYLFWRPTPKGHSSKAETAAEFKGDYNRSLGIGLSVGVGYLSSLLGIGGGIIHVPAMVHLLRFPVHIATATSHFVLGCMTLVGTLVHLWNGSLIPGLHEILFLGPGVIVGAQIGAKFSTRVHGNWIIRALALALASVGLRLLLKSA